MKPDPTQEETLRRARMIADRMAQVETATHTELLLAGIFTELHLLGQSQRAYENGRDKSR